MVPGWNCHSDCTWYGFTHQTLQSNTLSTANSRVSCKDFLLSLYDGQVSLSITLMCATQSLKRPRVVSVTLGRPFGLRDEDIEIEVGGLHSSR